MRKGYWKILLRRLRGRVASGNDTLTWQALDFVIAEVCASEDDCLDHSPELCLAVGIDGRKLFIDTGRNRLSILPCEGGEKIPLELDFPRLIDSLCAAHGADLEMGPTVDGDLLPGLHMPRRGGLIGD